MRAFLFVCFVCFVGTACQRGPAPQSGGAGTVTFGGTSAPTVVTTAAPENSKTPTTTTVEKTTTREFIVPSQEAGEALAPAQPANQATRLQNPTRHVTGAEAAGVADVVPRRASPPSLLRETVTERATTQLGSSWEDKARELGAKLSNMRGVMWAGVLLLIGGPIVGIKMGWPLNGAIAGGTGLVLIVLAQVVPGNEAWFGLGILLLIPAVGFIYYRAHHDATKPTPAP